MNNNYKINSYLGIFLSILILSTVIKLYFFEVYIINGPSMEPTYENGDIVFVNKFNYSLEKDKIAIFKVKDKILIKRIAALENEEVIFKDGNVYVNGEYVEGKTKMPDGKYRVPDDSIFVLGDNRENSVDSRDFGAVPESKVIGTVKWKIF